MWVVWWVRWFLLFMFRRLCLNGLCAHFYIYVILPIHRHPLDFAIRSRSNMFHHLFVCRQASLITAFCMRYVVPVYCWSIATIIAPNDILYGNHFNAHQFTFRSCCNFKKPPMAAEPFRFFVRKGLAFSILGIWLLFWYLYPTFSHTFIPVNIELL